MIEETAGPIVDPTDNFKVGNPSGQKYILMVNLELDILPVK